MWVLIYIIAVNAAIANSGIIAVNAYGPKHTFPDMISCFEAREQLSVKLFNSEPGYYPKGYQAICIQVP